MDLSFVLSDLFLTFDSTVFAVGFDLADIPRSVYYPFCLDTDSPPSDILLVPDPYFE